MQGVISALLIPGRFWARATASWALMVSFSNRIGDTPR